jgi:hypothetical protein
MAVAAGEAQASISKKISLGNGTYGYFGTFALGNEYATGGDTIATATGERYSLPEKLDWIDVQGPYSFELSKGKLKVYWPEKEKVKLLEVAAKTDLSAQTALPFFAIGC